MTDVFRISSAIAVVLTLVSGVAQAAMLDENVGPDEIGPVSIVLNDNAKDACWTNLKEVREYAEEKLRIQGYSLGEDSEAMWNYTLVVMVDAFRSQTIPSCVGSIAVYVLKSSVVNGISGLHTIGMENAAAKTRLNGNLNQSVIEVVQKMVDGM